MTLTVTAPDLIRAVVLLAGAAALGATVVVLGLFFARWWRTAAGSGPSLPLHIWTIAGSYGVLVVAGAWLIFGRLESAEPVAIPAVLYGVACLLGAFSLVVIGREQIARVRDAPVREDR